MLELPHKLYLGASLYGRGGCVSAAGRMCAALATPVGFAPVFCAAGWWRREGHRNVYLHSDGWAEGKG
jgi:hypothetical protein